MSGAITEDTGPDPVAEEDSDLSEQAWEPISRRPRRRLLTPLSALLFAFLVSAGGFIAGVEVEKGETSPGGGGTRGTGRLTGLLGASGNGTAGAPAGASAGSGVGAARGFGAGGGVGAGVTVGQVSDISGSDIFVTDIRGNTVKVVAANAQVTRQVSSSFKAVHPGDTVIVQGTTHANGSISAATIRDSAGAGGGIGALFGSSGGAGQSSGSSSGSSNRTGRGSSPAGGDEPALFGK